MSIRSASGLLALLCLGLTGYVVQAGQLVVASLNPLVGSIAEEVGQDRVKLVDLAPIGTDPHVFAPTPGQLQRAHSAMFFLVAGKGLEPFIDTCGIPYGLTRKLLRWGVVFHPYAFSREMSCLCAAQNTARAALTPTGGTAPKMQVGPPGS